MNIKRIKSARMNVQIDDDFRMQGECINYHKGIMFRRCFYKDDELHGEYRRYRLDGYMTANQIYCNGALLVEDATTLSNEDKFLLSIKHNFRIFK